MTNSSPKNLGSSNARASLENGVRVPTLVDDGGPRHKIIDGNYLMAIANELGYDCSETIRVRA
jgi:hypothetical protein